MEEKHTEYWQTKDGRYIRVCDMHEDHVRNTLCMLIRSGKVHVDLSGLTEEQIEEDKYRHINFDTGELI